MQQGIEFTISIKIKKRGEFEKIGHQAYPVYDKKEKNEKKRSPGVASVLEGMRE